MSIRRFNPFSSNSSFQHSLRSIQPPTYTSNVTPEPTYSFTSHEERAASAHTPNENASLPNASSASPESSTLDDETRSSRSPRFSVVDPSAAVPSIPGPRYLYYRVYTENGEFPSKNPINSRDPSLTRIKALSVAPPHTVSSIKRRLCSIEKIGDYNRVKLFVNLSSETPMEEEHVSLMTYDGPGATSEWPMVLVRPPLDQVVRAMYAWAPVSVNTTFLTITPGEILHTDGVIKSKPYPSISGRRQEVYKALNAVGSRGYVLTSSVEFVDTHESAQGPI